MRIGLLFSLGVVGASAWLAPRHHAAREPDRLAAPLVLEDPRERIRIAEEDRSLGLAYSGYRQLVEEDGTDLDAARGAFRTTLLLSAVALGQAQLDEFVRAEIDRYLERRETLDPDGGLLRDTLERWAALRLRHPWFKAQAGIAIHLAARGDEDGTARMRWFMEQGPFNEEVFPYARRYYPGWLAVEPCVRHYLARGDLHGRVAAGLTLLLYDNLFGAGSALLDEQRDAIRESFLEAKTLLRPADRDWQRLSRGRAALFGLAMLDEDGARETLASIELREVPPYADAVRIARMWAGLDSFDEMPLASARFDRLDGFHREAYFRAACHRYARLVRSARAASDARQRGALERAARPLREIVENGRFDSTTTQILCLRTLAACHPEEREELARSVVDAKGIPSLYAYPLLRDPPDPVPVFLPALSSFQPDTAGLAAAALLVPDGPPATAISRE